MQRLQAGRGREEATKREDQKNGAEDGARKGSFLENGRGDRAGIGGRRAERGTALYVEQGKRTEAENSREGGGEGDAQKKGGRGQKGKQGGRRREKGRRGGGKQE